MVLCTNRGTQHATVACLGSLFFPACLRSTVVSPRPTGVDKGVSHSIFPIPLQMLNQTPNSRQKTNDAGARSRRMGSAPWRGDAMSLEGRRPLRLAWIPYRRSRMTPRTTPRPVSAAQEAGAAMVAGLVPRPLALRKNRTPWPSPWAPSLGSTHWHQRALFHMALRKPMGPPLVSER